MIAITEQNKRSTYLVCRHCKNLLPETSYRRISYNFYKTPMVLHVAKSVFKLMDCCLVDTCTQVHSSFTKCRFNLTELSCDILLFHQLVNRVQ